MKILIAMSGGVDSSVIAHKLKEEGHELIGVMMKLWVDPLAPEVMRALPTKCCSVEHVARARNVCKDLDIPFYVVNLEDEFKKNVVDPFLKDYKEGRTPNPCINCNREIKFGTLLKKMHEFGCEKLATGHYARVAEKKSTDGSSRYLLLEAKDQSKDQSYYLYGLSQDQLSKVMFPLGPLYKDDVYKLAANYKISIPSYYTESQDLCFFPEKEPEAFLRRHITDIEEGPIKLEDGTQVGTHKGLPFYTIGQRKGLNIGGLKIPLHVVKIEQKSNTIYAAEDGADLKSNIKINTLHWVSFKPAKDEDLPFDVRISSLGTRYKCVVNHNGKTGEIRLERRVRGIAPGQSAVLYNGQEIIGGGVIY